MGKRHSVRWGKGLDKQSRSLPYRLDAPSLMGLRKTVIRMCGAPSSQSRKRWVGNGQR